MEEGGSGGIWGSTQDTCEDSWMRRVLRKRCEHPQQVSVL